MSTILAKIRKMMRAKRLLDEIKRLLAEEDIENRDIADENINKAVALYDRISQLEMSVPEVKIFREGAEIILNNTYNAMEWWFAGQNPHDIEPDTGLWS